jgi:tetratricopeptide (TPR) repeat protein
VPASLLLAAAARRVPAAADLLAARFPDYRPRLEAAFTAALAADPDRARALGRRLLRTEPAGAEIRLALADLELAAGAADAAREHLEALGAADRGRPDARRLEARLWLAADEPGRARRQLATLAQASPRDRRSWTLLAQAQAADGRLADAAASWRRALQLAPEDLASREQLARALMELDRYAEAARQWERLRSFELPRDLARSATFNHALALQRDDRDAEALPVWDALLAEHPDLRSATFNRALALQRLGRRAEAIAGYERVLTLDPDHEASQERLRRLRQEDTP